VLQTNLSKAPFKSGPQGPLFFLPIFGGGFSSLQRSRERQDPEERTGATIPLGVGTHQGAPLRCLRRDSSARLDGAYVSSPPQGRRTCGPIPAHFLRDPSFASSYKPQLKNGWQSTEADPMGRWKGLWNLPGSTWKVKANVDGCGNALSDVSGWKPADISWTPNGGLAEGSHAKTRRREEKEARGFP
jgi:hypothetical protein